jgi:hypothetical protein
MYHQIAPSGVEVYSAVPFHHYTIVDNNWLLFTIRSQFILRRSHIRKYLRYRKAR